MGIKKFLTLEEQISLLESRGLKITDREKTRLYLLKNNYYNVSNSYGKAFMIPGTDNFVPGSNFAEIVKFSQFDSRFKSCLFKFLLDIERYFVSVVAYEYSNAFQDNQEAYLNKNTYPDPNNPSLDDLIEIFQKVLRNNENLKGNPIMHYKKNYDSIPFWVFCERLSFGQMLHFYELIDHKIKIAVAKHFATIIRFCNPQKKMNFLEVNELANIMGNYKELRNTIAHNNYLFTVNFKANYKNTLSLMSEAGIDGSSSRARSVYATLVSMKLFLDDNQYKNLYNSILSRAKELNKSLVSVKANDILMRLGFPKDFHENASIS